MGYASALYQRAHTNLKRVRGKASEHTCPCGKPARDWAYQFTGETIREADGSRPYSNNPDDYVAMCRSCHIQFDTEHDPEYAERRRTGNVDGRAKVNAALAERRKTDPVFVERMNKVLRANNESMVKRRKTDPQFAEKMQEVTRMVNAVKVQCGSCGKVTTRGAMGMHQKFNGHIGRRELS